MDKGKNVCENCGDRSCEGCEGGCCGGACATGDCGCGGSCGPAMGWHGKGGWHHNVLCGLLVGLVLLTLAGWLGLKARNEAKQYDYIGVPIERDVITVSGEGKVVGVPDVALVDLGTTIERRTVADAQQENTRVMNQLHAELAKAGIEKKDVQTTGYNVYPVYDWVDNKQRLRGYTVAQNVRVKIRDLSKVGDILGMAGNLGANQVGGLRFEVDDPEELKQEARLKAIENAKTKAEALSQAAGVKLRRVVSFDESVSGPGYPPVFYDRALGFGGAEAASAPTIEAGSSEIVMNVSITYEIE